jgi:hypothetical protein
MILPFVLYGYGNWSLTLKEERRLRVFENRVLRKLFEPNRKEVIGYLRRLRNKEHYDLFTSPNIIRVIKQRIMRWAGYVARMGNRKVHRQF